MAAKKLDPLQVRTILRESETGRPPALEFWFRASDNRRIVVLADTLQIAESLASKQAGGQCRLEAAFRNEVLKCSEPTSCETQSAEAQPNVRNPSP